MQCGVQIISENIVTKSALNDDPSAAPHHVKPPLFMVCGGGGVASQEPFPRSESSSSWEQSGSSKGGTQRIFTGYSHRSG